MSKTRLTPEDVKRLLITVIELTSGLLPGRVIRETESGPRPSEGLYCTMWWRDFDQLPQGSGGYTHPCEPTEEKEEEICSCGRILSEGKAAVPCSCGASSASVVYAQGKASGNPDDSGTPAPALPPCPVDFYQEQRNETYCTVQISFWGEGSWDAAARTVQALHADDRWFDLWRVIGFGGTEPIKDTSIVWQGHVQQRCSFDLSFYACFGRTYPAQWFDTASMAISAHAGDFHQPVTEQFAYLKEIADEPKPSSVS